jgi:hypothetical protein
MTKVLVAIFTAIAGALGGLVFLTGLTLIVAPIVLVLYFMAMVLGYMLGIK